MGTTISSLHVYTPDAIDGMKDFYSFSEGWQTYLPPMMPEDPFEYRMLAKRVSKRTDAPVLWFYIFDSEAICFEFYHKGKRVSAYSQEDLTGTKNLYAIPTLIGYEKGEKRRLSRILSCADADFQLELLEEYFGVCLITFPELLEEGADALRRDRGDQRYLALLEEDRKLTGKQAKLGTELVSERGGKIFERRFGEDPFTFKPHHYYFGYTTFYSNFWDGALRPVRFEKGELVEISQEEFDNAPQLSGCNAREDVRFKVEFGAVDKVHFTDEAPEGFSGKTLAMPRGFFPLCFDEKGRVILSDERGGLAVVDDTLKIIAKIRVKGTPVEYLDGYILTAGGQSFYAYAYNRSDAVRIYKVCER